MARTRGCPSSVSSSWIVDGRVLAGDADEVSTCRLEVVAVTLDFAGDRRLRRFSATAKIHAPRDCYLRDHRMVRSSPPKAVMHLESVIYHTAVGIPDFRAFPCSAKAFIDISCI